MRYFEREKYLTVRGIVRRHNILISALCYSSCKRCWCCCCWSRWQGVNWEVVMLRWCCVREWHVVWACHGPWPRLQTRAAERFIITIHYIRYKNQPSSLLWTWTGFYIAYCHCLFLLCEARYRERFVIAGAEQITQYANNYLDSNLRSVIQCHNLHNTPRPWQTQQTNNQVRDRVTVTSYTASAPSLGPDDPIWVRWPHASLGYLANVMTQEIYCGHKNGEIGSGPTQSDLASVRGESWSRNSGSCLKQVWRSFTQYQISTSIDIDKVEIQ